jgi:nucleosome binding factor SPN SPT16 subunit
LEFERTHEYRELGFFGVHHRTNVLLLPTLQCLVQLIEIPFLVLTLSEVQIAHLERVQVCFTHSSERQRDRETERESHHTLGFGQY